MRQARHFPVIMAGVGVALAGLWAWPYTVDDAFIVARYARHLHAGQGYGFNPGTLTDGLTGPLWVLPMWLGEALGLDALFLAKAVGLVCSALSAMVVVAFARRLCGGARGAWWVAALLVVQPNLAIWGVAGLETGLATFLVTVAILYLVYERGGSGWARWLSILCMGTLPWLRPELTPVLFMLAAWVAIRDRKSLAPVLLALAVGLVSVVGFRLVLFGTLLPLSVHAKPGEFDEGLHHVARGVLVMTSLAPILLLAIRRNALSPEARFTGLILLVHCAVVTLAGGDWMPGFRLLTPLLPTYAFLLMQAVRVPVRDPWTRRLVLAALMLGVLVPLADMAVQLPRARQAGVAREEVAAPLARWMREHGSVFAAVDVGYLGWKSGLRVVDLGGITDPAVGRARGNYLEKRIDPGWLEVQSPDLILLHATERPEVDADGNLTTLAGFPVERSVATMPWVRRTFRVERIVDYASGYYYVLMVRRTERRGDATPQRPWPSQRPWP